jgi:peptidoglycan/xylan/chitin deacetylase (PgdA/CDA1 family)
MGAFVAPRSLKGQTMRLAPIKWPHDAKIAVSFFVAFEAFEKYSQYRQGGDKPDYASLAYGEYGGKAGIWRIMDVLNRNGVKGTIDTNGRIAEDFPDALKELHGAGHEIVGHGWVNDTALSSLDAVQEKTLIKRTLDTIASVTGKRPVGWVSPGHRVNEYTFANFVDEGIFWTGDLLIYHSSLTLKIPPDFILTASKQPLIASMPKDKPARRS